MQKININGEELTISFNLATEISYEEITGKAFDASILFDGEKPRSTEIAKVVAACIIANNPEAKTDSDYLLYKASREEANLLITTTLQEMLRWLNVPAIAEEHIPEQPSSAATEEEGEQRPNA